MNQRFEDLKTHLHDRIKIKKRTILGLVSLGLVVFLISATLGKQVFQQARPDLSSFIILNFAGYIFFLLMPVEALVPFFIAAGYPPLTIAILAVATAIAAQFFNYSFGYLMSSKIISDLIGEKRYEKVKERIKKYGDWTIFSFNLLPLSSPVISVAAGMVRYKLWRLIAISAIGLVLKYAILAYFAGIIWPVAGELL
ncbi:hypothetical protein COV20_05830 [Candidatus Woesearchaeota archaeon CG10_big_fil_rev_8_21_14_0_10_45_16]|nr:MAG: hypothetical protein COV20_05830 [Candidatus Woesearchaeota archaeon CG10_big_fil_rev_8_21_14_0_10_45_16]